MDLVVEEQGAVPFVKKHNILHKIFEEKVQFWALGVFISNWPFIDVLQTLQPTYLLYLNWYVGRGGVSAYTPFLFFLYSPFKESQIVFTFYEIKKLIKLQISNLMLFSRAL